MGPRTEERLGQGDGASQLMQIFRSLRKRGKTSRASRAVASSLLACLPWTFRFFSRLYYLQASATQATSFIALRPFSASFSKQRFYCSNYHSYHVLCHYVMIWWW